ncbi:hypothetical protein P879_09649 [Paragonimus westermani]|uniref:Uncharacterized protein n=1 Tax=Paragonimus westermani TaxID=34504 RepID=A0A8T0D1P4_9TREM|nr:hypothetical protein P879_09649 [Paragonimus westermani]
MWDAFSQHPSQVSHNYTWCRKNTFGFFSEESGFIFSSKTRFHRY